MKSIITTTTLLSLVGFSAPMAMASALPRPKNLTKSSETATYSGYATWIGNVDGAYAACGQVYEEGSMFVAVEPGLLQCGAAITINYNGGTVTASVVDKCMGCTQGHIDVAGAVYAACGGELGPPNNGMNPIEGVSWSF